MDEALRYLRQYVAQPRILSTLPSGHTMMAEFPEWWRRVLLANGDARIQHTLNAWAEHRAQLPAVFDFLAVHLRDVSLLIDQSAVRLLYQLERDEQTLYYAGGNPLLKSIPVSVQAVWDKLPPEVRRFYDTCHNGWYYLASNSMGPSPVEDFFVLDDLEWGILEDIGDPGCDLKDLVAVYTNGMGGYVALSIERKGAYGDVLWWKDKAPTLNIDAWGVIDAWTELGLQL